MGLFKKNVTVTKSLAMSGKETGAIVGVKGAMLGRIYRMQQDEETIIGSDANCATLVLSDSCIDGKLCSIRYNQEGKNYFVRKLGTGYMEADGEELLEAKEYTLDPGTRIILGNETNEIRLG